jgi:hypothetical protein
LTVLNSTWVDLTKVSNHKIQWPNIPGWWQKKGYCSDMPNVQNNLVRLLPNCFGMKIKDTRDIKQAVILT